MRVDDFDYLLPHEAIAQRPAPRGASRLMTLDRRRGAIAHRRVADLPDLLREGDVLVVNDTRVLPARLFGRDAEGRRTEILLAERRPAPQGEVWECLAKPGRRAKVGRVFDVGAGVTARVLEKTAEGRYVFSFEGAPLAEALATIGTAPLPPYIDRPEGMADARDAVDYQTVYAKDAGAIAAPTAGLHFTDEILDAVRRRGVDVKAVTLHVGLGTFKPVKVDVVEEHRMDVERGMIPPETAAAVNAALDEGRRVVAVGTTTVRALESSARLGGGRVVAGPFATDLFLTPGVTFAVVSALMTNFHLPRSTLLMLVSAFAGRDHVLAAYRAALDDGYRFFSYGDAMFIS